jgi:hypothetical protein
LGGVSRAEPRMFPVIACCFILLLISAGLPAQSEKKAVEDRPGVIVVSVPLKGPPDPGVRKVLSSALRFQLEALGLRAFVLSTGEEEELLRDPLWERGADPELLFTSLMDYCSGLDHDFLALAGYIEDGEEIQVSFYIADLRRGEILASASRRSRIDLTLDEAMIEALRDMLPQAEERIAEAVRRKAVEAAGLAEKPEAGGAVTDQGAVPIQEQPGVKEPFGEQRFRPFEFSVGFAPFVPVGAAGDVFSMSYAPFVYGSYRIALPAGVLGLGLYTGLTVFDSEEAGLASYFHYIVPLGVDVRYTVLERGRIGLFLRACVGAAVNVSDFSALPAIAQEGLSRFLGHGSGGAGGTFAFSPSVGMAIDVMYETFVYFYQEGSGGGLETDWIMGFAPSVYLYTRL